MGGQEVREYRASRRNAAFGVAVGAALGAAWVWLLRMPLAAGATSARLLAAVYLGWIVPTLLLSVYWYQLIAHPAVLVLDGAGLRRRTLMRETLICWEDVAKVVVHRYRKARKVDVVLHSAERTEAERVRAAALAGPWTRIQERGTTVRIEHGLTILPLEEIATEIAARVGPRAALVAVDYPTVKQFNDA